LNPLHSGIDDPLYPRVRLFCGLLLECLQGSGTSDVPKELQRSDFAEQGWGVGAIASKVPEWQDRQWPLVPGAPPFRRDFDFPLQYLKVGALSCALLAGWERLLPLHNILILIE
jgi:hypothetical protein